MKPSPEETTCGRCHGHGIIERFSHVVGGICFRCWGCGVDPQTAKQLEAWLVRARQEFSTRRASLRAAKNDEQRARLQKELQLIEKMGKQNRKRLDRIQAWVAVGKAKARFKAQNG